jgi:drug/metabolite transporter (DMT)-like permease
VDALSPTRKLRWLAALAMMCSVLIYGANFVISRQAVLNGFTAYDLAALRFGGAGLLLFPLFLKAGGFKNCAGVGWQRGIMLAIMSGAPMSLLQLVGVSYAPASHGATIGPGTVSMMSVIGGVLLFGAVITRQTILGLLIVIAGLVSFAISSGTSGSRDILTGDALFLCMALLWGCYPLALQKWKVDALTATAILSVLSLSYLPFYWAFLPSGLSSQPLSLIALHGFNQAVLNMIVGLWLWGWAARTIGAADTAKYPPMIPVVGTILAIPILDEWPVPLQVVAMILIVTGLLVMAVAPRQQVKS